MILPLLNGYDHYARLWEAFGKERVLGGLCFIETTLDENGSIIQTSPRHDLVFGEWEGGTSTRTEALQRDMEKGAPVETDHLHGALLALAEPDKGAYPVLTAVYGKLKVYEASLPH